MDRRQQILERLQHLRSCLVELGYSGPECLEREQLEAEIESLEVELNDINVQDHITRTDAELDYYESTYVTCVSGY